MIDIGSRFWDGFDAVTNFILLHQVHVLEYERTRQPEMSHRDKCELCTLMLFDRNSIKCDYISPSCVRVVRYP
jgi:hypothetical protein